MRILMVNKFLFPNGGSETYMLKLGDYLASQGHEVQYFGMDHEMRIVGNSANAYTSNMDFHSGNAIAKALYPVKTIYSFEARRKIRKVLEEFRPDLVHLNNFNYQLTPSIILEIVKWREREQRICKIIYTAHDYQLVCPNHMLRNPNTRENCEKCLGGHYFNCETNGCIHGSRVKSAVGAVEAAYWHARQTYKFIDAIICPSEFSKAKLDSDPLLKKKTVVVPNFISVPDQVKSIKSGGYVLFFGRLCEEKGVRTLVEACKRLPHIPFVFVGDGPLTEIAKRVKNIDCRGFQQGEGLWRLVGNASFCICPSEYYEVFGLSIGESMALGTPVVASSIGGIPELLDDGVNGLLVEPGNVEELTRAIDELWHDAERIIRYSQGAAQTIWLSVGQYSEIVIDPISCAIEKERRFCANSASATSRGNDSSGSGECKSNKKAIMLADATADSLRDFTRGLNDTTGIEWEVRSRVPSNLSVSSKIATMRRYALYFSEPWKLFLKRKDYVAVIGWQQFYAYNFALYCDIFRAKKAFPIYALNCVYKPKSRVFGWLYHAYMKKVTNSDYVDLMHVSSKGHAQTCASSLGLHESKVFQVPFGVSDASERYASNSKGEYALAIGRSNRDFEWLIREWRGINYPLVIISDSFRPKGPLPETITLISDVTGDDQFPYFAGCRMLVMPLDNPVVCSGDTVLLTGMSFSKTVIVTTPSVLGDTYINDGVNGCLCSKEHGALAKLVESILEDGLETGPEARKAYLKMYSLEAMGRRIGSVLRPSLDNWLY